jgi:hypothetical protein
MSSAFAMLLLPAQRFQHNRARGYGMKKMLSALAVLLASSQLVAANYSNEVYAIGVGARPLGMGGAYVAMAEESSAVYWNPAGLSNIKHIDLAIVQQGKAGLSSSLKLNEVGSEYLYLSGALSVPGLGSFGAGFLRFGVKGIDQVNVDANGEPSLDSEGGPVVQNQFSTEDLGFQIGYGKLLTKGLRAGLGVKILSGGTKGLTTPGGDAKYSDYGIDLGLIANTGEWASSLDGLNFGLTMHDIYNSGVKWTYGGTSTTDEVKTNFRLGLAYAPPMSFLKKNQSRWSLLVDMETKYSPVNLLHYGTEFWYRETLAVRAGARSFMGGEQATEVSVGASVRFLFLSVDYAYINYELTPMQYLSMGLTF